MTGAGIILALQIGSAALGVVSAIKSANAERKSANFNAAINRQNAAIATQNAELARKKAAVDAQRADRERRLRAGANIARLGGSGVTSAGSPLDVLEDNTLQEELTKLRIINNGELNAIGFERQANSFGQQADLYQNQADSVSPIGGIASSVLAGASAVSASGFGFKPTVAPTPSHADQITF